MSSRGCRRARGRQQHLANPEPLFEQSRTRLGEMPITRDVSVRHRLSDVVQLFPGDEWFIEWDHVSNRYGGRIRGACQ